MTYSLTTRSARISRRALALATILDNYGIISDWQPNYNMQRQELEDIIANMADVPPPAPVTVADVTADISASLLVIRDALGADLHNLGQKIDALIGLANAHGEAQQAAAAARRDQRPTIQWLLPRALRVSRAGCAPTSEQRPAS